MTKIPTIKSSAQGRLLLYQLLSSKLSDVESKLLLADPSLWEQLLLALEKALEGNSSIESEPLAKAFSYIDRTTREGLQQQVERLAGQSLWLGVFPKDLLDSFIDEHQKLIKSVRREHLDKIGLAIKRGLRDGHLPKDIAKDIRHMTTLSKRRAQLIARNAPLHYSGALTKHHQISAGIKQYRWQTSGDERVRNSHQSKEGRIYAWGLAGPHPRSEVNCRCDAVPWLE